MNLFILLCIAVSGVLAETSSPVVLLDAATFDETMAGYNGSTLVKFYAPWCGFCQQLAVEYDQAAEELAALNHTIYKVNCQEDRALCVRFGIRGYPTVKTFRNGKEYKDFSGMVSAAIVDHLIGMNGPATMAVESVEEYQLLANLTHISYVGLFNSSQTAERELFEAVAEESRGVGKFVLVSSAVAAELNLTTPGLVVFKPFDERVSYFDGQFTREAIRHWVLTERPHVIGEIDESSFGHHLETGIPLAFVFYLMDDPPEKLKADLYPVALKHKGKISIGLISAFKYRSQAEVLGLEQEVFPAVSVHDFSGNLKYPMNQSIGLTAESLDEWLTGIRNGTVAPKFASAPIPEADDGPVKTVVHDSFKGVVMDKAKDVVLEYYATWCEACERAAPTYEKIAASYASNDSIVFARMDLDKNDQPLFVRLNITNIPVFYLFPAGEDKTPVLFDRVLSARNMSEFIQAASAHKVVPVETEADKEVEDHEHEDL